MPLTRKYRKSSKTHRKNTVKRSKKIKKRGSTKLRSNRRRQPVTKKRRTRKNKQRKSYKGGNNVTRQQEEIPPIPVIIDDDSINQDELDAMELDLADDSFASYDPPTPNTSIMSNHTDDGETTTEDISFDRDDEEDDEEDVLNTGFYE
jgi:hypothetical protein|uniref:Uncharacterized protein n=1 Tax=viral metagenome TaxID=1070528 RepID=A0A6C0IPT0_9ZZZZ